MKAVQRMLSAWRRFFFMKKRFIGCKLSLHTVIFHGVDSGWLPASPRSHLAAHFA
jgi:hypothetical protein